MEFTVRYEQVRGSPERWNAFVKDPPGFTGWKYSGTVYRAPDGAGFVGYVNGRKSAGEVRGDNVADAAVALAAAAK